MKKVLFILVLLISQSCETKQEVKATRDFSEVNAYYKSLYDEGFKEALQIKHSKKEDITQAAFTIKALNGWYGEYFDADKEFLIRFESFLKEGKKENRDNKNGRISSIIVNEYPEHYTPAMIAYCEDYLYPDLDNATTTWIARSVANSFEMIIISASDLTYSDQVELMSLVNGIRMMADLIDNGVIEDLGDLIEDAGYIQEGDPNARMGCSVDTRAVLTDAVVGFFGGGASGAYVGCTTGSFTIPIFGTATGCVGGAVLGAASGFVGGALYSVASQLLQTCFR